MLGFARNIVFFSGKRRLYCGDKLARVRNGFGRRRFSVESCSICARAVSKWLFLFFVDAVLVSFAAEIRKSHCSGCIKVATGALAAIFSILALMIFL